MNNIIILPSDLIAFLEKVARGPEVVIYPLDRGTAQAILDQFDVCLREIERLSRESV